MDCFRRKCGLETLSSIGMVCRAAGLAPNACVTVPIDLVVNSTVNPGNVFEYC